MKHNLKTLFAWLHQYHKPAATEQLKEYCENPSQYFSGLFSLKYCILRISENRNETELKEAFRQIAENLIVYNTDPRTDRIDTLPVMRNYPEIQEKIHLNVHELDNIVIGGYIIVVNETERNLTSQIFARISEAEAIIFQNPESKAWGFVFRENGSMVKEQEKIHQLIMKIQGRWEFNAQERNGLWNMIINGGAQYKLNPGDMTIKKMIELLQMCFAA